MIPVILVSVGDLAGVNPHLIIEAAKKFPKTIFRLMAEDYIFKNFITDGKDKKIPNNIQFLNAGMRSGNPVKGRENKYSSYLAYASLLSAIDEMHTNGKMYKGLLTLPLSKKGISFFKPGFIGHTEMLAREFKADVSMVLHSKEITVCPMTTHIALEKVSREISYKLVKTTASNIDVFYKKYLCKNPKMKVLCINPHCSDNGLLGDEDRRMSNWVRRVKHSISNIEGPVCADSAFVESIRKSTDVYITSYHDQSLIPFKMLSMHKGVNITAGLPFVRISPAHGPAYDIAHESKKIDMGSMEKCIEFLMSIK